MADQENKVVALRVAANRRDWGVRSIEEITEVLNNALEHGERILIFVAHKDEKNNEVLTTRGFTRHNFKVSWLEMMALLQIKLHQWYGETFL